MSLFEGTPKLFQGNLRGHLLVSRGPRFGPWAAGIVVASDVQHSYIVPENGVGFTSNSEPGDVVKRPRLVADHLQRR